MLYINSNCNQLDIINIYRLGLKKIGVQFKYPKNANDFLLNNTLDKSNFNVFIAPRLVTSMGIVRDVGIDIPDHEIVEKGKGLYPDAKVLRVRRFNRSPILKKRKNIHNTGYDKKAHNECLFTFDNGNSVKSVLDSKLNNKNNDEDGFVSDTSARCEGGETTPYNKFDKDVKNSGDIFKRKLVSYKKLNMDVATSSDESHSRVSQLANELGLSIKCIWIPSHSYITNNDIADSLAKDGRMLPTPETIGAGPHELWAEMKCRMKRIWVNRFREIGRDKGIIYAQYRNNDDLNLKCWFSKINRPRRYITNLIRLRSGHCLTPAHLFRIGINETNLCKCGSFGDISHLFLSCADNLHNIS
ncbi:hypothetical protein HHI36_019532, partial [Cryptolaemus montrouzieri]